MYQVQDWAEVHRLFHREGWAKTKIAEKLGMSRQGERSGQNGRSRSVVTSACGR